jgi:hypothetical protein
MRGGVDEYLGDLREGVAEAVIELVEELGELLARLPAAGCTLAARITSCGAT